MNRDALIALAITCTTLASGCLDAGESASAPSQSLGEASPQPHGHLTVYLDNSARNDANVELRIGNDTTSVSVPYNGSQPNVKRAYDACVSGTSITIEAREQRGQNATFTFPLHDVNFVTVSFTAEGRLDAWISDTEPVFD